MTKAQQVRSRRMKAMEQDLKKETEKVFSWILDLIDKATDQDYFPHSIRMFLYENDYTLRPIGIKNQEYNLFEVFVKHGREGFFKKLKKTIDQEEGYTAKLDLHTTYWDEKATILEVVIE